MLASWMWSLSVLDVEFERGFDAVTYWNGFDIGTDADHDGWSGALPVSGWAKAAWR